MVRTLALAVMFFVASGLFGSPVGTLGALEGQVSVLRAGALIPSEKIDEGFGLEPFDTVILGATGQADIRFVASLGLTGSVHLDPGTVLYLDNSTRGSLQVAGVELLSGGTTVRLTGNPGPSLVEIRTLLGTFTGTGPVFRVVGAPNGDVLTTSAAGKVQCQVGTRTVYADPGTVVEVSFLDRVAATHRVNPATLDSFEGIWVREKSQILRDQAAVYFRAAGSQYQLQLGLFQRAWDRVALVPQDGGQEFRAAVANLRRAAFPLERTVFLVRTVAGLVEEGVLSPSLDLSRGYSARDFFRQEAQDEVQWLGKVGEARNLYKTVSDSSGGNFPEVTGGEAITWQSPYFQ